MMKPRLLLVDDEEMYLEYLSKRLINLGFEVTKCLTGEEALQKIEKDDFDVIILDWLVPDMDGLEVLNWIRKENHIRIPVLFVTILTNEEEIVMALNAGADDFMSKPVKRRELLARLEAITRRCTPDYMRGISFSLPPYMVQFETNSIQVNDQEVELTQKEFDLAVFLFRRAGQVVSRGHILESVWGANPKMNTRTVDTHISRLRNKLGIHPDNGVRLNAIYNHGYRLETLATSKTA